MVSATEARRARLNQLKENQLRLQDSFQAVFDTPDGKRVLAYLVSKFFVDKTAVSFGASDVARTFYNNGQRDVVIAILKFIYKDKAQLIKQIEENYR